MSSELRTEMAALGSELRTEMTSLGSQLRSEMAALGSELRTEMQAFRWQVIAAVALLLLVHLSAVWGIVAAHTH